MCWSRGDVELSQGLRHFLFLVAQAERDDWNNWNFGTLGTCLSRKRFERSEAVERLERSEPGGFVLVSEAVELDPAHGSRTIGNGYCIGKSRLHRLPSDCD